MIQVGTIYRKDNVFKDHTDRYLGFTVWDMPDMRMQGRILCVRESMTGNQYD